LYGTKTTLTYQKKKSSRKNVSEKISNTYVFGKNFENNFDLPKKFFKKKHMGKKSPILTFGKNFELRFTQIQRTEKYYLRN
jgi:hypothetical protein